MRAPTATIASLLFLGAAPSRLVGGEEAPRLADVPARIERSLALIQSSEATWRERRSCISCHHQLLGAVTLAVARERGFSVNEARLPSHLESLRFPRIDFHLVGDGGINAQISNSYLLLALAALRQAPDSMTDGVVHLIAQKQHASGSWRSESYRPPMEASEFTATALSLRGLQNYAPPHRVEMERRVERAAAWLENNEPFTTEEHVMRLFGLAWADRDLTTATKRLLDLQREDGGWAQLPTRASDAYATGQALVALNQAGAIAWTEPALERGIQWLVSHGEEDGSWHVATRRKRSGLPHFESGFPHGKDQFLSCAATCWASLALMLSERPGRSIELMGPPLRDTGRGPPQEPALLSPLFQVVVSGRKEELEALLEGGADVNETSEAGATPLMVAVAEPAKVRLLLQHGARVSAKAKNLATALSLAAAEGNEESFGLLLEASTPVDPLRLGEALFDAVQEGNTTTIQKLLDRGADPNLAGPEGIAALHLACFLGDAEVVRLLAKRGADVDAVLEMFDDETALITAAGDGKTEIVAALLAAGADLEARDDKGRTALHWAAVIDPGHPHVIEQLLEAMVDVSPPDDAGETPLQLARLHGNHAAVRLLEEAGAE